MYGLFIIENIIDDNLPMSCAYIKEYSYYQGESETLFFPFSCFDIKSLIQVNEKEFIINLNYLGKFSNLFGGSNPEDLLEYVPEWSKYAKEIFNAKIIKPHLKLPKWLIAVENKIKNIQIKPQNFDNNIINSYNFNMYKDFGINLMKSNNNIHNNIIINNNNYKNINYNLSQNMNEINIINNNNNNNKAKIKNSDNINSSNFINEENSVGKKETLSSLPDVGTNLLSIEDDDEKCVIDKNKKLAFA